MTRLFESVRRAGTNQGVQVKVTVAELVDLLNRNMGGPGAPGGLQLANGMDVRMLPADTRLQVRLAADESFNRPMQMSNADDNAAKDLSAEKQKSSSPTEATDEKPAIKIEGVSIEQPNNATSEPATEDGNTSESTNATESTEAATAPARSVEAERLLKKGVSESTIIEVETKFGIRWLKAMDRLVADGVQQNSAIEVFKIAQRQNLSDEILDLINSGRLRQTPSLRTFLEKMENEIARGQFGTRNELLEAATRAAAGNEVSLGGTKFDPAKPESGQGDVVQYGKQFEAVQMKTVTGASDRAVASNLDKSVSQLKGKGGEVPPAGAKKIARAIIDNPRNPLFNATRQQLVDGLRGNLDNLDATDAIEIQIRNAQGEHVLHASELVL